MSSRPLAGYRVAPESAGRAMPSKRGTISDSFFGWRSAPSGAQRQAVGVDEFVAAGTFCLYSSSWNPIYPFKVRKWVNTKVHEVIITFFTLRPPRKPSQTLQSEGP